MIPTAEVRSADTCEQPGFMRTEMTKGVGFDKFWDDGGGKALSRWKARLLD